MSLVKIIEIDEQLLVSQKNQNQIPASTAKPLNKHEVQSAVERGHALRAQFLAGLMRDLACYITGLTDKIGTLLRSGHFTAHGAR